MDLVKLCSLILLYFISRIALAADCDVYSNPKFQEKMCWHNDPQGLISEACLKKDCEAKKFLSSKKKLDTSNISPKASNPAEQVCHFYKLPVVILKDSKNNKHSFCLFKDKSLASAAAVQGSVE